MKPAKKPHGEIRQSQLITTFGPGSMLDLPNYSVLVAGLEFWSAGGETISEPRLSRKLARVLEVDSVELKTPPPANDDPGAAMTGITGFHFRNGSSLKVWKSQRVAHPSNAAFSAPQSVNKGKVHDRDKKKKSVVPVRFVRACRAVT